MSIPGRWEFSQSDLQVLGYLPDWLYFLFVQFDLSPALECD